MPQFYRQALDAWDAQDLPSVFDLVNKAMQSPDARHPKIFELLGHALLKSAMPEEAAEAYQMAAERSEDGGFDYLKQAIAAQTAAGQEEKAFLLAMRAQKLVANDPDVVFVLVKGFLARGETELLEHFKNRLTLSDKLEQLQLAAELISAEIRNPYNLDLFKKLIVHYPDDHFTHFKLMAVAREFCDYETVAAQESWLDRQLAAGNDWIFEGQTHFANLLHCEDERLNRLATNNVCIKGQPSATVTARRHSMPHTWKKRIRIGYLSNDFGSTHATMRLLRNVLELHDRDRFDISLYCYTSSHLIERDDGGRAHWGTIVPVRELGAEAIASKVRSDGIDILVDLKGHTGDSRSHALNHPAAPIHVAWLGFPGSTTGVDIDYVIGDRFVLPESSKPHYHEKFVHMPASYQPNDRDHRALPPATSRRELGLPEEQMIFATFNTNRKITRQTLDLWAEIMHRVPNSTLWAMIYQDVGRVNFSDYLNGKGIASERIIFTEAATYEAHIARVQAADLCLDTFPYNGHTTTSDMLWAGLPVLTKRGSNFASRVSESLLNAVGLPELVARDERHFVELAVRLSDDRPWLGSLRKHLVDGRPTASLFDPRSFCSALETAYGKMVDRARKGLPPDHFDA
ncbi:MAG: putative UDP-N-acetylglucosamine-peptide N-acetylglucosaminyltransferase [Rhizobium sp.]|nr:putative UDP-N-acetylglucosamine-peptide N-acetylglucosaminyltransferase [Rhizobium sp.]